MHRNIQHAVRQTRERGRFVHLAAVLQALFVTFLWSTSWVLIKIGLQDIPALTFAGVRYVLALICLLPFLFHSFRLHGFQNISSREYLYLVFLGLLLYTVTQGAQFLGLAYLPSMTVSLLLNFTTIVVALMSIPLLAERPTPLQWSGIALSFLGITVYLCPSPPFGNQIVGMTVMIVGVLANAGASVLGRQLNRDANIPPLTVTGISMGIGAPVLLLVGILTQGLPDLNWTNWLIISWLAVVNTAFAFTLWNHTLRTLSAVESNIINGTMLVQIGILAWLFFGERLSWRQALGIALAGIGALIVQIHRRQE